MIQKPRCRVHLTATQVDWDKMGKRAIISEYMRTQPSRVMQWNRGDEDFSTGALRNLYVTKTRAIDPIEQIIETHNITILES